MAEEIDFTGYAKVFDKLDDDVKKLYSSVRQLSQGFNNFANGEIVSKINGISSAIENTSKATDSSLRKMSSRFGDVVENIRTLSKIAGTKIDLNVVSNSDKLNKDMLATINLMERYKGKYEEVQNKIAVAETKKNYDEDSPKIQKLIDQLNNLKAKIGELSPSYNIAKNALIKFSEEAGKQAAVSETSSKKTIESANREKDAIRQINQDKINDAKRYGEEKARIDKMVKETERKSYEERRKMYESLFGKGSAFDNNYKNANSINQSSEAKTIAERNAAISQMQKAIQQLNPEIDSERKKIQQLNNEIARQKGIIDEVNGKHKNLLASLKSVAGAVGIAYGVQGIVNFAKKIATITGEFELQRIALGSLIKDQERANMMYKEIQQIALKSPYSVMDLTRQIKQLAAYRVETEELIPTMKRLGDIASGVGVDMGRLILVYGQVKAANYLRGQELRQFSEAGVNILGELAQKYTDLEGRTVSVGEVFERVSKRMVSFQDVKGVIEDLTNEGGTFYKMQERQAETIYGQIGNLKDAWQITMSEIGKSNYGTISNVLKTMRFLATNIKEVIDLFVFLGSAAVMGKVITSFGIFIERVKVSGNLSKQLVKSIGISLPAAASSLAVAIGVSVVSAIIKYNKACAEIDKKTEETIVKIKNLTSAFKETIASMKSEEIVEGDVKIKFDVEKGVKEYKLLIEKLSDIGIEVPYVAFEGNEQEIAKQMAERILNIEKEARRIAKIQGEAAKAVEGGGWSSDKLSENNIDFLFRDTQKFERAIIEEYGTGAEGIKNNLKDMNESWSAIIGQTKDYSDIIDSILANKENLTEEEKKQLETIRNTNITTLEQEKAVNKQLQSIGKGLYVVSKLKKMYDRTTDAVKDLNTALGQTYSHFAMTEEIASMGEKEWEKIYKTEEGRIQFLNRYRNYILAASTQAGFDVPESAVVAMLKKVNNWIQKYGGVKISVDFDFGKQNDKKKNEIAQWVIDQRAYIEKAVGGLKGIINDGFKGIYRPSDTDTIDDYLKAVEQKLKDLEEMKKILQRGDILESAEAARLNALGLQANTTVAQIEQVIKTVKVFAANVGGLDKDKKGKSQSYMSEITDFINFIKRLHTETEKLDKTFNNTTTAAEKFASALSQVSEAARKEFEAFPKELQDAFRDLFNNEKYDFANESVIDSLLAKLEVFAKETPKYKSEIEKILRSIGKARNEITFDLKVDAKKGFDEEIFRQIQDAFDKYEFGIEIDKLGISKEAAKDIFGLDTMNLGDLQKKIFGLRDSIIGEDALKKYEGFLQKVYDITDKSHLERIKKYSAYLQQEMSKAVAIEMEYQMAIAELDTLPELKESGKYDIIKSKLEEKRAKELSKQKWEDFKGTDMYISLFEDLGNVTTAMVENMKSKLASLRNELKNLDPASLKEIARQIEALDEELSNRNPFHQLIEYSKEWKKAKQDLSDSFSISGSVKSIFEQTDEQVKKLNESIEKLKEENKEYEEVIKAREKADTAKSNLESAGIEVGLLDLNDIKQQYEDAKKAVEEGESELAKAKEEQRVFGEKVYKTGAKTTETGLVEANRLKARVDAAQEALDSLKQTAAETQYVFENATTYETFIATSEYVADSTEALTSFISSNNQAIKTNEGEVKKLTEAQKKYLETIEQSRKSLNVVRDTFGKVNSAAMSLAENIEAFGVEDVSDSWREFAKSISGAFDQVFNLVDGILAIIPTMVAGFTTAGAAINASMGIIGLIAEAIQLVITLVTALAQLHDNQIADQMKNIEKSVDRLKDRYEDLEEAFKNAFDAHELYLYGEQMKTNIESQIENLEKLRALEEDKKKTDEEAVEQYTKDIADATKQLKEAGDSLIEEMGGFTDSGIKSAAQSFVDAWYDAFQETGDGLSALNDTFDSFMDNIVKKQMLSAIANTYLPNFLKEINDMITSGETLTTSEAAFIQSKWDNEIAPAMNIALQNASAIMSAIGSGGELSGLQAGIKGITEDTANIIEGYLNSIRLLVAEQNNNFANIANLFSNNVSVNPMLAQIQLVAENTTAIHTLLESVTTTSDTPDGTRIKVYAQMI